MWIVKRIGTLLEAEQKSDFSAPPLVNIGGDGPERVSLEHLALHLGISERVRFHGQLTCEEVRSLIQASHIVVSSSYVETFGIALTEAMACGKPVIAARSSGPESSVNHTNGLPVPTGEPSALTAAMQQTMKNYTICDPVAIRADCIKKFGIKRLFDYSSTHPLWWP